MYIKSFILLISFIGIISCSRNNDRPEFDVKKGDTINLNRIKYCEFYSIYGEKCIYDCDTNKFYLFMEYAYPRDTTVIISINEDRRNRYLLKAKLISPFEKRDYLSEDINLFLSNYSTRAFYLSKDSIESLEKVLKKYDIVSLSHRPKEQTVLGGVWINLNICDYKRTRSITAPLGENKTVDDFSDYLLQYAGLERFKYKVRVKLKE